MKARPYPLGDRPPESVFLLLDGDAGPDKRKRLLGWLEGTLPSLNWRSHVFVLEHARTFVQDGGPSPDQAAIAEVARVVSRFLERHEFTTLYLHPVVTVRSKEERQRQEWDDLLAPAEPFHKKAYREQGEARFLVSPVLTLAPGVPGAEALDAAEFFSSRFATPSLYAPMEVPEGLIDGAVRSGIRFYVDPKVGGVARQLWMSHVFETVLDRVGEERKDLLAPCRAHLVVDERGGKVFSCFRRWEDAQPSVSWDVPDAEPPGAVSEEFCAECIGRSLLSMRESLVANDRKNEGRQVYFKTALAFSAREAYLTAADLARHAFEFSEGDEDRAASLIQEGLCRLNTGELQKADETLVLASQYAADQALVAFYRGQVQFAWRDYIEALDRFGEALKIGSDQVPAENICFQMALCHINIEEYSDARQYLARCPMSGQEAVPVSFYRGICDLGEGRAESAMAHFLEALALGPSREDLSRVLFNIGTCLKELGRLDEAIDVLRKAVEADPEDLVNHNLLGFCYYKMKRPQQAVDCFRRAVEVEPNSAIDWANLASNLRDMGETKEAVAMYEKALSLDPTIGFARVNLAALKKILKDRGT